MIDTLHKKHPGLIYKLSFLFAFVAVFTFLALRLPNNTQAASLANFRPGNIISDYTMSNYESMTVEEIDAFLHSHGNCNNTETYKAAWYPSVHYHIKDGHFVCLADEVFAEGVEYGDLIPEGTRSRTAAEVIYDTAHTFQINPQVLLVLLEKEQGLISDSWPNSLQYRSATGFGCPDTAPCNELYYGFVNQLDNAAYLFRTVLDGGWTNYPLGENYIYYNPNRACGGSTVNIENLATSSLYRYTPYQPNQAALNAGYGTVACGAYGNRNFYLFFMDWFGDPTEEYISGYLPFENPRYMKLKEDVIRINPFDGRPVDSLKKGRVLKYVTKIKIGSNWYYRTENNTNSGLNIVVPASALEETEEFESFITPRYMYVLEGSQFVNPYTKDIIEEQDKSTSYKFNSKVFLDGEWYYRTEDSTANGQDVAVKATSTEELSEYEPFITPRYMRLNKDIVRINPFTLEERDTLNEGRVLKYITKIQVLGKWYYRTENNTRSNLDYAVEADALSEISEHYENFYTPRYMNAKGAKLINPFTKEEDVSITEETTFFDEKIFINGEWYYRPASYTKANTDKVVSANEVSEIKP